MKIDLTCPAELWRCQLPREDSPACELTMYNLSDKLIVSMEVTLTLLDKAQEEICRVIYRAHDLHGQAEKPFPMSVPVDEKKTPASAEVVVEKIWFDDNSVWRRGKMPLSEYTSNALPNSRSLENLRYIAGKDAVGYPEEQTGLWVCVCGRPNQNSSRICIRCHRNRTEVFSNLNKEAVQEKTEQRERQLALKGKQARESASRHQAQREKEYEAKQRIRRRRNRVIAAVAACAVVAYGTVFHLLPYLNYRSALELMDQGSYQEAITAFAEMDGYRDAQANITRCTYLDAQAQLASTDAQVLLSARDTLLSLGEYEDAAALAQEADYLRAGVLLKENNVSAAREVYLSLTDYKESAAQVTWCDYLLADASLAAGNYADARTAFEALGEYKDAASKAKECIYRPAVDALNNGDVQHAALLFEQIPGYQDADALLLKAKYLKAEALRKYGDLIAAGEAYLLAEGYEDALDQANQCLYQAADEASLRGDHVKAADLFARVLTYQDASERWMAETYHLAVDALDDLEYIRARTLLSTLPDDYKDVTDLRLEVVYRPALTAYKKAEDQSALDSFLQLGEYKDSPAQAQKARYQLAESLRVSGQYAEALAHYELLGDYEDTAAQMRLTRYNLGVSHIKAGKYQEAMVIFTDLGTYKDSSAKLKEATYGSACALLEAGDYDTAREQFASLGKYSDAKQRIPACDYGKAQQLLEAGQLTEAAELFLSLGKYEDAKERGQAAYYNQAVALEVEGRSLEAAAIYEKISGYQGAAERAAAIYAVAYDASYTAAKEAITAKDYALAIAILRRVDMSALPDQYADMPRMLQDAYYQEASRLYAQGDVYGALPFFQQVTDYRNVNSILGRSCYLMLGQWLGENGETYTYIDHTAPAGVGAVMVMKEKARVLRR